MTRVLLMVFFCTLAVQQSYAEPIGQAAADNYEACIIGLRHISKEQIRSLGAASNSLKSGASQLANLAVSSCRAEKEKLRAALQSEGKLDTQREAAIRSLEEASKIAIKLTILDKTVHVPQR